MTAVPAPFRRARRQVKLAIDRFGLIREGEKVVVGVSGGADSLCLVHALNEYNTRSRKAWDLVPVHIDPGFKGWSSNRVVRACARIGLECRVIRIDVPAKLKATNTDSCFFCARERRKALFQTAHRLGTSKVALAHHMDDVNETFLMNLLMGSSSAAFVPKQELFKGEIVVIRPLYYLEKPRILAWLRELGIRPVRNQCPFERTGTRQKFRRFLDRLYRGDSRIRTNIFWGIHNLKPQYLPRPIPRGRKAKTTQPKPA